MPNDLHLLSESLLIQVNLLAQAALIEHTGAVTSRDTEVRKMLNRSAELVRGAATLGTQRNDVALAVLARTILENLIVMLWVAISETNAIERKESGLAELARLTRVNLKSGKLKVINISIGEDATADFVMPEHLRSSPQRKSVEKLASEAGVSDLYNIFYRGLSMELHGHELIESCDRDSEQASVMHMQGIGALSKATGHVGVHWLRNRERTDNATLRGIFGF